jgi:DNA-binding XRE family transcriptional regulator
MEARMNTTEQSQRARLLTPNELALLIKVFREMRQWSQEQLAAISGLNVRTVQRADKVSPPISIRAVRSPVPLNLRTSTP